MTVTHCYGPWSCECLHCPLQWRNREFFEAKDSKGEMRECEIERADVVEREWERSLTIGVTQRREKQREMKDKTSDDLEHYINLKLVEKEDSPPLLKDNRTIKKSKLCEDERDIENEMMIAKGASLPHDSDEMLSAANPTMQPISFLDKLLNKGKPITEDEDIKLNENDFRISKEGVFPSIRFSPRVHKLLEESMKFSLKLLG